MTNKQERGIWHNQRSQLYASDHSSANDSIVTEGLDFILSHFEEPIWPRTIFTHTLGKQLLFYNKQEAPARFNRDLMKVFILKHNQSMNLEMAFSLL